METKNKNVARGWEKNKMFQGETKIWERQPVKFSILPNPVRILKGIVRILKGIVLRISCSFYEYISMNTHSVREVGPDFNN